MKPKTRVLFSIRKLNEEGESIVEHIAKQAKKAREEQGLSRRELSLKVNKSHNFISKLENLEIEPSITDIIALSKKLGKPISYFLPARYRDKDESPTGQEWEIVDKLRGIKDEETRRTAIEIFDKLSGIKVQ